MSINVNKETEIGLLPADWEVMPLNKVADFTRKPRSLDLSEFDAVPFVPMAQIPENGISIEGYELRAGDDISSGTYCERGNILLAKITPSFENGKQAILADIPLDFAYATTEVYAFDAKPHRADQMFLFYYFCLPRIRADLAGKMEGSTGRQRIRKNTIAPYPIVVPSLPEQRRIAGALRAIQEAIAAQEDVIAAARELKRSLMERLFTYGPGAAPAPTKETEIGEIPVNWDVVELQQLIASGPQNGMYKPASYYGTGTPILRIDAFDCGDIIERQKLKRLQLSAEELEKYALSEGDFVVNRVNGNVELLGKSALAGTLLEPTVFESNMMKFSVKTEIIANRYLLQFWCSTKIRDQIRRKARIVHQTSINQEDLKSLLVALPSLSDQNRITSILTSVDQKIAAEEQRKAALEEVFRSALEQLMTGQIRLNAETQRRRGAEKS